MQKSIFVEIGFLMIPGSIFHDLGSLATNFHGFCCLGDWLEKLMNFHVILGSSQILSPESVGAKCVAFWGNLNHQTVLET